LKRRNSSESEVKKVFSKRLLWCFEAFFVLANSFNDFYNLILFFSSCVTFWFFFAWILTVLWTVLWKLCKIYLLISFYVKSLSSLKIPLTFVSFFEYFEIFFDVKFLHEFERFVNKFVFFSVFLTIFQNFKLISQLFSTF
jgi:hypothetical protein